MDKIKVEDAQKEILRKLDEIHEIFLRIDHEAELVLSVTMMSNYKSCAVYEKESLKDVMQEELAAGHGVNITIDCLGGDTVGECLPYMEFDGRWIMIATLAGDPTNVSLRSMYVRGTRLIGTTLRRRTEEAKAKLLSDMVELIWPKVEDGTIRPTIFKVFPIEDAEAAQDLMYSGKSAGKIVLTVGNQQE